MARLHEHQGKELLEEYKIPIPKGCLITSISQINSCIDQLGDDVVLKGQAWITGRAKLGLISIVTGLSEATNAAHKIFGKKIGNFRINSILVEEKLDILQEFYAGVIIDDVTQSPMIIFSSIGGTGIEDIARQHPTAVQKLSINIRDGLFDFQSRDIVRKSGISGTLQLKLSTILLRLYKLARKYNARSAEINPLVLTSDGNMVAADCRITIDDNAAHKYPNLGIEIAREFDRPPTKLEKIAWNVEKNDYRGTFYFIQMEEDFSIGDKVIGFHGAGGGGSMMSMDAILNKGYKLANFVDTSGNPPASKVYRAAKIILSQDSIDGYFASGSGVASQEQFHSARGLVKAFLEEPLSVPAVLRLGGNAEQQAIAIINRAADQIRAPIEAYGKDSSPEFCAQRLVELINQHSKGNQDRIKLEESSFNEEYSFYTVTNGRIVFDYEKCKHCATKICIETCVARILDLLDDVPVLNISMDEAKKGKCIECLACEIECHFEGNKGCRINLPIPGLS